jgi:hypothetical protein
MTRFNKNNLYDYSKVKSGFHGFYATPEGDLYLSSKLVIGENFSANKFGYLKASNAMFEDCNANCFDIHDFNNGNVPSKDSYFSNDIKNPDKDNNNNNINYTHKLVGRMGTIYGKYEINNTTQ